jgi:hypothetical protein
MTVQEPRSQARRSPQTGTRAVPELLTDWTLRNESFSADPRSRDHSLIRQFLVGQTPAEYHKRVVAHYLKSNRLRRGGHAQNRCQGTAVWTDAAF